MGTYNKNLTVHALYEKFNVDLKILTDCNKISIKPSTNKSILFPPKTTDKHLQ